MNAEPPQTYFDLAASHRADLERSIATERAIAAERRREGRRTPRFLGQRRRWLAPVLVGTVVTLGGITVYAVGGTDDEPPPIEFQPVRPLPRPLGAPVAV